MDRLPVSRLVRKVLGMSIPKASTRATIRHARLWVSLGTCSLGLGLYAIGCSVPDRTYYDDSAGSGGASGSHAEGGNGPAKGGGGGFFAGNGGDAGMDNGGAAGEAAGGDSNPGGGEPGTNRPVPTKGL